MLELPSRGQYYKDFKGNTYRIIPTPKDSQTGHFLRYDGGITYVWYEDVKSGQILRRSLKSFMENVIVNEQTLPRFTKIYMSQVRLTLKEKEAIALINLISKDTAVSPYAIAVKNRIKKALSSKNR